jgi:CRISPR/Cas system CSM-associated protein Csm3 (group 7 of RAMP superfamily)
MSIRLTLFTATLVQDSALSVSGLDRESTADQPFAIVDDVPILVGRGLKGAAVAMAKRFFDPLPRAISDDIANGALRRSAWEFADATTTARPCLRAGVGIRHRTGARASGVLYDREVIPAGTKWRLSFRVDWSHVADDGEGHEVEGILGYVLEQHWKQGRCWLGGGVARGLGWCHIEGLKAYRFDPASYDRWVESGRTQLPRPLEAVPVVQPTRSWCFRTLDLEVSFGEYKPDPAEAAWGLDMLAIGPHDSERTVQPIGDGVWAKPAWATDAERPEAVDSDRAILTDRAILMEGDRPLLPGASFRGPLRHAFSRSERAAGREVKDPHLVQGDVGLDDPAGQAFGTIRKSSRILVRDARAEAGWAAAKLHMHAEDEFSAGSYGSAKRDAVRLLKGVFPLRIVVEGATPEEVEPLVALIDRHVALGALGHLPVGGHKTRGAGWGRWHVKPWRVDDVKKTRTWWPSAESESSSLHPARSRSTLPERPAPTDAWVRARHGALATSALTLAEATQLARSALGERALVAWWCEPTIDLALTSPPATFGREWPEGEGLQVDEVAFYAERAVWRAARTAGAVRYVLIEEIASTEPDALQARVAYTRAWLHGFPRFSSANTGEGTVLLREWYVDDEVLGFTIAKEQH